MASTKIGTINMRSPAGLKTSISVSLHDDGKVDLHISRSSEGEVLIMLPIDIAAQLGGFLVAAVTKVDLAIRQEQGTS